MSALDIINLRGLIMGIRVVNKRKDGTKPRAGEIVIAIDRPSGSVLKNQHFMAHEGMRDDVILKFSLDLTRDWNIHGPMHAEIERIAKLVRSGQDVALACWCAPKACHGDVIKQAIESIV